MGFKADGNTSQPVNNTYLYSEERQRTVKQIKGWIENGTYRIEPEMIAATLARLLKEQNSRFEQQNSPSFTN